MSCLDVLSVSAVERTVRNIVYRDDCRLGAARLGTQGEGHSGVYGQVRHRSIGLVRAARFNGSAFVRERQIKKWKREWKIQLIEADNPQWIDLYPSIAL
jgi:predicted GIY-YIG superfamily endonuclease